MSIYPVVLRANGKWEALKRNEHYEPLEGEFLYNLEEKNGLRFQGDKAAIKVARHRHLAKIRSGNI